MNVPRYRGLAAGAVALFTVALPLQASAAPHRGGDDNTARCAQVASIASQYPQLATAYPGLKKSLQECNAPQQQQQAQAQAQQQLAQLLSFNDLSGYSWAQSDINLLQSMGIMQGVGNGDFRPGGVLSRVQFAALLQRVFHLSVPSAPMAFVDISQGFWGYNAVEAAGPYMGEFQTPGGLAFEPDLPMVRIDVAASLGKIEVAEGMTQLPTAAAAQAIWAGFADGSLVPAGLSQYAAAAVQSGVMKGYANGNFGVEDTLNRAQAAVLLARVLQGTETMPGGTTSIGGTSSLQGTVASASGTTLVLTINGTSDTLALASTGVTVTINGESSSFSQLAAGQTATVTLNAQGQVIAIAATGGNAAVSTLSGTVTSDNGSTLILTVNGVPVTLSIASGVSASATDGQTVTVSLNAQGQIVALEVTGNTTTSVAGTVVTATATSVTLSVNGVAETYAAASGISLSLVPGETVTLTLNAQGQIVTDSVTGNTSSVSGPVVGINASAITLDINGTNESYALVNGVTVTLNGQTGSLASVTAGQTATLTLNAGNQVTAIAVTSASATLSGTIVSVSGSTIAVSVSGSTDTFSVAAGAPVTIGGAASSLSDLAAGETVTLTLNGTQVTAISATAPVATQTVNGYIISDTASNVAVAVYGGTGATLTTYNLDPGATITLNGTASTAAALPLGDAAAVGIDAAGHIASVAATTATGQVSGQLVSVSATQATVLVNGSLQTIALGSAPVAFSGGSLIAVTSLPLDTTVTIAPSAMGGSALLVH